MAEEAVAFSETQEFKSVGLGKVWCLLVGFLSF